MRMLGLILLASLCLLGSASAKTGPTSGSVDYTDQTWSCRSAVNMDSVTVTITANSPTGNAVLLMQGCTGRIGSLTVNQYRGDGVKIAGPQNLVIEGGTINCLAHDPGKHQDGVQVLGGSNIQITGLDVECHSANNSQVWMNPAHGGAGASNVIFHGGKFNGAGSGSYGFANVQSTDSGVEGALICPNAHPARAYFEGSPVRPVNVGNTIAASC